jgi:alanine racemase
MARPIWLSINLAALRSNLAVARKHSRSARILAVLKANAYGHGLLRAAGALARADGFAVLDIEDGVRLREHGVGKPVVLLEGFFHPEELPVIADQRLTPVIHCTEQLEMLAQARLRQRIDVYVKVNTGMNRLGLAPETFRATLEAVRALPIVERITLMTHFACADDADGIADPLALFKRLIQGMPYPNSLANSATLLRYPEASGGWVRPGIMLYGSSPFAERSAESLGLRPAMTLTSAIIAIQHLNSGDRIGYGGTYMAGRKMRVGVVACGYADGYPRHAPTGTPVLVGNTRTRTLGRVSMDMLCVDISELPLAGVGTSVTLWGKSMPVEEVAAAAGTIGYELLCGVTPRVPVVEVEGACTEKPG